ncbi:MAG: hypothetical protein NC131_11230 [Roseburia sp.]|nr:hypothetical protein [Roseburia sp.]
MEYILYIILSAILVTALVGLGSLIYLRVKKDYIVRSRMTNSGRGLHDNYDSLTEIDNYIEGDIMDEDKYDFD